MAPERSPPVRRRAPRATASRIHFPNPFLAANRVGVGNHRPNVHCLIPRVADLQLLHERDQVVAELRVGGPMNQDSLHRDAGLPGVVVAAAHTLGSCDLQVGVAVDHARSIASQLQNHPLFPRFLLECPAHSGAAGKGQQVETLIGNKEGGVLCGARDYIDHSRWQVCFRYQFGQEQGAEGCL